MDYFSIVVIAFGLAMDSVAVCISQSACRSSFVVQRSFKIAMVFGLFQGLMPLAGYLAGMGFASWIERFDHWFAFVILGILGVKMLMEQDDSATVSSGGSCECTCDGQQKDSIDWKKVVALSFATSIDAMVTGLIFVPFPGQLFRILLIIAFTTVVLSFTGMYAGTLFGRQLKFNTNIVGGIILIAIGSKILLEHTLM
ncbi:MAG: manganese efflux pump [Bacteroidia bacterium]|nr:manganese efflux pump [Bacteroidia bacterium]